ncbi:MAG: hypothetical protein IPL83_04040 [Bdellovibrionales bacterium]|nr:hypothetical protein [Bdellovibrionales bacterium]
MSAFHEDVDRSCGFDPAYHKSDLFHVERYSDPPSARLESLQDAKNTAANLRSLIADLEFPKNSGQFSSSGLNKPMGDNNEFKEKGFFRRV